MSTYRCDLCQKITYRPFKIKIKDVGHTYDTETHKEKWTLCFSCAKNIQYIIQKEILNEHGRSKEPSNGDVSKSNMASESGQYAGSTGLRDMAELSGEEAEEYRREIFHFLDLKAEEERRGDSSDDNMGVDEYPY